MKGLERQQLARMVASQLPRESFVNLGIGAPTHVADYMDPESGVILHSENGILNVGPAPALGEANFDLINAGKSPVTLARGGSFFDSSMSFAMMRGGHIDVAVLGAFEVSQNGDLANWNTGRDEGEPPGVGGAMDLAVGAKQIWVMMEHVTREGAPRIVAECTLPLTAKRVVSRVFTSLAIVEVMPDGLVVSAMLRGARLEDVQARTGAPLRLAPHMRTIEPDGKVAE
ncbi:3-oxoacid CoA-transferase subunit B [Boseaceae bacterium BT-24-1]|nr:3-oxoacid CoA-transferase subunit B [Boseaceae bacterium BT-24-1]